MVLQSEALETVTHNMDPSSNSDEVYYPFPPSQCTLWEHHLRCGHVLTTDRRTNCFPACAQPKIRARSDFLWPVVCRACKLRSDREFLLENNYVSLGPGYTLEYDSYHPKIDYDPLMGEFREEVLVRVIKNELAKKPRKKLRKRGSTAIDAFHSSVVAEHWLQSETWYLIRDRPDLTGLRMVLRELCGARDNEVGRRPEDELPLVPSLSLSSSLQPQVSIRSPKSHLIERAREQLRRVEERVSESAARVIGRLGRKLGALKGEWRGRRAKKLKRRVFSWDCEEL